MVYGYDSDTTYTPAKLGFGYGACNNLASVSSKVVSISGFTLATGGIVVVRFKYAVNAGATLSVNLTAAKAIYYRGVALTDGVIKAGDTVTMVYSTYYRIIAIDRDNDEILQNVGSNTILGRNESTSGEVENLTPDEVSEMLPVFKGVGESTLAKGLVPAPSNPLTPTRHQYLRDDGWSDLPSGSSIVIDSSPTSGSENAVSSGGVYDALEGKLDKRTTIANAGKFVKIVDDQDQEYPNTCTYEASDITSDDVTVSANVGHVQPSEVLSEGDTLTDAAASINHIFSQILPYKLDLNLGSNQVGKYLKVMSGGNIGTTDTIDANSVKLGSLSGLQVPQSLDTGNTFTDAALIINDIVDSQIPAKLNRNFGSANNGYYLKINSLGNVIPAPISGGSGSSVAEVYWATYGTTDEQTIGDVGVLRESGGMMGACLYNGHIYTAQYQDSSGIYFYAIDTSSVSPTLCWLKVSGSTWTNGTISLGGSGASEVFWATYGTTTGVIINNALDDNILVVCNYNDDIYIANGYSGNTFYFYCIKWASTTATLYYLSVDGSTWSNGSFALSGGSSEVFVATYGTTTYAQLTAAILAKKNIICYYGNEVYHVFESASSVVGYAVVMWAICVSSVVGGTIKAELRWVGCDQNNVWNYGVGAF